LILDILQLFIGELKKYIYIESGIEWQSNRLHEAKDDQADCRQTVVQYRVD